MNISILGLTKKEENIYLSTLRLGESTATNIAKHAGVERTTAYNLLPNLLKSGFLRTTIKKGISYYIAEDPKKILQNEEERLSQIKNLIPKLQAIHTLIPNKPSFSLYEGVSGLRSVYNDVIASCIPGDTLRAYAGTKNLYDHVPKDFLEHYANMRLQNNIFLKLIATDNNYAKELQEQSDKLQRQLKTLGDAPFDFQGEVIIYGNKVAFISYSENYLGIIIESKEIHSMHRDTFDALWSKL